MRTFELRVYIQLQAESEDALEDLVVTAQVAGKDPPGFMWDLLDVDEWEGD